MSNLFEVNFVLLASKCDSTPSGNDELELNKAGLGRRSLGIAYDLSHAQVQCLILNLYIFYSNVWPESRNV